MSKSKVKHFLIVEEGDGDICLVWDADAEKAKSFETEAEAIAEARERSAENSDDTVYVVKTTHIVAVPKRNPIVTKVGK